MAHVYQCPHCDVKSRFTHVQDFDSIWGRGDAQHGAKYRVLQCDNCTGHVLVLFKMVDSKWEHWHLYPHLIPTVEEAIPPAVAEDYIEGLRCFGIGANKAAATMFRRSLQGILLDKGASPKKKIYQQIDELGEEGILQPDLVDWAHEIRFWGNDGGHPNSDGLDDIGRDDVQAAREFVENLFEYLYVMPNRVARSRARRQEKKKKPGETSPGP